MRVDLGPLVWRSAAELVEALARHAGLDIENGIRADENSDVEQACSRFGLEVERIELLGRSLRQQLRQSVPAVLPFDNGYLGVAAFRGNSAVLLAPDLSLRPVRFETLRDALCAKVEARYAATVSKLLDQSVISARKKVQARRALLEEQIASQCIGTLLRLCVRPGSNFVRQVQSAGLGRRLILLCLAHAVEYLLWVGSWWILGISALDGRMDHGLLTAWVLTLLTIVALHMVAMRSMGTLGLGLSGLLKQRLLAGALRLESEQIRHQGSGQLLGRVMESEAIESMAVGGGLAAIMAGFELLLSATVLAFGAGGLIHVLLLAGWVAITGILCRQYARRREHWTDSRLQMTNDLVEVMSGHRTRLVQSTLGRWHDREDEELDRYLATSRELDTENRRLSVLVAHGWLIVAFAGLAPALLSAVPTDMPAIAIGLGGVLLAHQALSRMGAGLSSVAGAVISWKQVAELFHAAARREPTGLASTAAADSDHVMRAEDIRFGYRDRLEPVLSGISFDICKGDWVLLEGGSGSGKSTLASVLVGSREPQSGVLLAGGLDRGTLGARQWRRHVAMAPQYHENHIFTETLAFNLLFGRRWPASEEDLVEVEAVCRELGLGELIDRMPMGMQQLVGETGWQLSQGEKSRVFMARALLQGGKLTILDESFGALDPETLRQCLECVLKRSETLVVVAHP